MVPKIIRESSKEFLEIQTIIECRFTLKCIHGMIRTFRQMHGTDKYSEHGPVWLNG